MAHYITLHPLPHLMENGAIFQTEIGIATEPQAIFTKNKHKNDIEPLNPSVLVIYQFG